MAYQGINHRQTAGYVTDGAGETYSLGAAYPVTRAGLTFGWSASVIADSRDRATSIDRRIAGDAYVLNTTPKDFNIDLPNTGVATIRLALGDGSASRSNRVQLLDGGTVFATFSTETGTAVFTDASGTNRTTTTWPTSNASINRTFATTQFTIRLGDGSSTGYSSLAHVSFDLAEVAADTTAPTMTGTMTSNAITDTGFTIDWSATARSDNVAITGYETSPDNATWTDQGSVTAKAFTGKTASTGYTTYVRAYDAAGYKSTPALSISVTTSAAPDAALPTMNGSLASSAITSGGFTLSWPAASDNVAVTGYEGSLDNGGTWTNWGNVLTKAVVGLTAATLYNTKVRAYDLAGNKATPLSLAVTTSPSADSTVPALSGSITISAITNTGATLAWPAGSDNVAVAGYEYSLNGGTSYIDNGNVLSKTLTGLISGTAYPVRVRAYDAAGNRSTPPLSATLTTTGLVTVTIAQKMKSIMSGPRAGLGVTVFLHDYNSGDRIATKTGLTLGSDGLPPSFTIVGPAPGSPCGYTVINPANPADKMSGTVTPG